MTSLDDRSQSQSQPELKLQVEPSQENLLVSENPISTDGEGHDLLSEIYEELEQLFKTATSVALKQYKTLMTSSVEKYYLTENQIRHQHAQYVMLIMSAFEHSFINTTSNTNIMNHPQVNSLYNKKLTLLKSKLEAQISFYIRQHEILLETLSKKAKEFTNIADCYYDDLFENFSNQSKQTLDNLQTIHEKCRSEAINKFHQLCDQNYLKNPVVWQFELLAIIDDKFNDFKSDLNLNVISFYPNRNSGPTILHNENPDTIQSVEPKSPSSLKNSNQSTPEGKIQENPAKVIANHAATFTYGDQSKQRESFDELILMNPSKNHIDIPQTPQIPQTLIRKSDPSAVEIPAKNMSPTKPLEKMFRDNSPPKHQIKRSSPLESSFPPRHSMMDTRQQLSTKPKPAVSRRRSQDDTMLSYLEGSPSAPSYFKPPPPPPPVKQPLPQTRPERSDPTTAHSSPNQNQKQRAPNPSPLNLNRHMDDQLKHENGARPQNPLRRVNEEPPSRPQAAAPPRPSSSGNIEKPPIRLHLGIHMTEKTISVGTFNFKNCKKFEILFPERPSYLVGLKPEKSDTCFELYDLLLAPSSKCHKIIFHGKTFELCNEELIAAFFYQLKQQAEEKKQARASTVVFSLSFFATSNLKERIQDAAQLAGFRHIRIISSALSAAITELKFLSSNNSKLICLVELDSAALNVTIIEIKSHQVTALAAFQTSRTKTKKGSEFVKSLVNREKLAQTDEQIVQSIYRKVADKLKEMKQPLKEFIVIDGDECSLRNILLDQWQHDVTKRTLDAKQPFLGASELANEFNRITVQDLGLGDHGFEGRQHLHLNRKFSKSDLFIRKYPGPLVFEKELHFNIGANHEVELKEVFSDGDQASCCHYQVTSQLKKKCTVKVTCNVDQNGVYSLVFEAGRDARVNRISRYLQDTKPTDEFIQFLKGWL